MEKRISAKIDNYQVTFKEAQRAWLATNDCTVINKHGEDKTGDFLRYMYDYAQLVLSPDDFRRRKRVTNTIPICDRCIAKRASGDQCTRRKKDGQSFCGTHSKGAPHGVVDKTDTDGDELVKIDIWVEEIHGIQYYLDNSGNVYDPKDIIQSDPNPRILAKWTKDNDGNYHIPSYNI
tara:strand:- start:1203 stop:1733 length:531 start_codon:yes stop_codon:yes gene_type:complete